MINRLPQITLVFDRRKRATSTKKGVIEIRITHDRKQLYLSIGVFIYPNCWKSGSVINTSDALEL